MMIIEARNISKKYVIPHHQKMSGNSNHANSSKTLHHGKSSSSQTTEDFWALKDVSFSIPEGHRVGIIGRNGSGKSTLLKILSRITHPTSGSIILRGRVASLLEVGTGFHPDLTGQENIFLNGAILGMRKKYIKEKFDEIVDFAEIEKFLDTPVKYYSSGMYVRLAFAVAAHLEPNILIADEVFAVGDFAFQKKCIAKMKAIGDAGSTILVVSHNLAILQDLCDTGLIISNGQLLMHDAISVAIDKYLIPPEEIIQMPLKERTDRRGNGSIRLTAFTLQDENNNPLKTAHCGQNVRFLFDFITSIKTPSDFVFAVGIDNELGQRVTYFSNTLAKNDFPTLCDQYKRFEIQIDNLSLTPGLYRLTLYLAINGEVADWITNACTMTVEYANFYETGQMPPSNSQGHFLAKHQFKLIS